MLKSWLNIACMRSSYFDLEEEDDHGIRAIWFSLKNGFILYTDESEKVTVESLSSLGHACPFHAFPPLGSRV